MKAKVFSPVQLLWILPAALLLSVRLLSPIPCSAEEPDTPTFSPYVETWPDGRIDWDRGEIYGIGRGYLHLNGNSKGRALRAAQVLATAAILKIASGIRLDDRTTLQKLGRGRQVIDLRALIRYEEAGTRKTSDDRGEYFEVTRRAGLKGVEGLTAKLLDRFGAEPDLWNGFPKPEPKPEPRNQTGDAESDLWLIIDARKITAESGIRPALFPEILTPDGERVYGLEDVDRSALVRRGMARYVISDAPADQWGSAAKPEKKGPEKEGVEKMVDRLLSLWESEAFAQEKDGANDGAPEDEKNRRPRRRRYIVKDATAAQGLSKTNLVISENDAKAVRAADANSSILKKCRVIVVANSPLGGIEGHLLEPSEKLLAQH